MKKSLLLLNIFLILSVVLAGCSKSADQATSSDSTGSSQAGTSLSQVNMLLVGTLKLEDTDQAVSADEAGQLLTLWQAYRSLSNRQTSAEAEVEALLKQIESTMTADQVQAIKAMNLTSTDMMSILQSMGGLGPQGTPDPKSTPSFDTNGNFPAGEPPAGGTGDAPSFSTGGGSSGRPSGDGPMPGGGVVIQGGPGMGGDTGSVTGLGGGPMTQGTSDPSMQATAQARFSTAASQVNIMLLDVLITKLETKTAQ